MSEYQYYEFRAIDKPLTERQMGELRMLSTRADITPTSFTNEYHWGDFKGNPHTMMEKYFDAFLYYANWGTNWFMLRLPRPLVDAKTLKQFCGGDSFAHWFKGEHVLLEFRSEDESGGWEDEDDPDWLASLISLRADLLNGDLRSLYLGWLAAAQAGDVDEEETEPAVPPGLKRLSASLTSLADFLRIDQKLLKVAAASDVGKPPVEPSRAELARWVKTLPASEKDEILRQLLEGDEPHLRVQLLRRFRESSEKTNRTPAAAKSAAVPRRTAGELLAAAGLQEDAVD